MARSLDQAGQIGHDETPLAGLHDAERGHQRGERIRGRRAVARPKCGAAASTCPAFGRPTSPTSAISFSEKRSRRASPLRPCSAVSGAWRVAVAKRALPRPPRPPRATTSRWSCSSKIGERLGVCSRGGVANHGADRQAQHAIGAVLARPIVAATVHAIFRAYLGSRLEVEEGRQAAVCDQHDVAAVAPVAAVRAAARVELVAPEARRSRCRRARRQRRLRLHR